MATSAEIAQHSKKGLGYSPVGKRIANMHKAHKGDLK